MVGITVSSQVNYHDGKAIYMSEPDLCNFIFSYNFPVGKEFN